MTTNPKISVVTVCRNAEQYIRACIESVVGQNYANIEYIIVDGASNDNTLSIIKEYESKIHCIISEPDSGPADALNKGFLKATGDILCWLNADDKFHPYALSTVAKLFTDLPNVDWITGFPSWYNAEGTCLNELFIQRTPVFDNFVHDGVYPHFNRWSKTRFASGDFLAIQQESVFWRASLWKKAGAKIEKGIIAFDFELWVRFFQWASIYTAPVLLSGFRVHKHQLSEDQERYIRECQSIIEQSHGNESIHAKVWDFVKIKFAYLFKPFYYTDIPLLCQLYPTLMGFPKLIKFNEKQNKFTIDYI
ncbi:MAG: glycosyltransferase [Chitinophagales bacterium]|nr:glycosyltransferase [Chitinophagales bacterium]